MSARDDYPPASITSQWAEMCDAIDSLREQLARQAPVIEAAEVWLAAYDNELYAPKVDDRLADAMNEYVTVRALSVPAPSTEVVRRDERGVMLHQRDPDDRKRRTMSDDEIAAVLSAGSSVPAPTGGEG